MSYKSRLRKNIRSNFIGFDETRISLSSRLTSILTKLCVCLSTLSMPLIILCATLNLMLRIPDLYSFFLTKHKVLDVLELDITNSEIASYISNFFNHKNELDIVAYFKGIEQPIFSQNDILILHDIRTVLDNMIIIAIICFIILLFCSVYLLKQASIREIRQAVHISTVFGLILAGFASFSIFFSPIRRKILNVLSNGLSKNTDLLIEFFKDDYYQLLGILVFIGNIILLFLILSFVRKRTKQTSLFKTTLEGVDKLKYNNSSSN